MRVLRRLQTWWHVFPSKQRLPFHEKGKNGSFRRPLLKQFLCLRFFDLCFSDCICRVLKYRQMHTTFTVATSVALRLGSASKRKAIWQNLFLRFYASVGLNSFFQHGLWQIIQYANTLRGRVNATDICTSRHMPAIFATLHLNFSGRQNIAILRYESKSA